MTDAERTLLLAFIDSTINQLQALRGAVSLLSKEPGKITTVGERARHVDDDTFSENYAKMMSAVQRGNDLGEAVDDK
jgi:hypothetical protein